MRSITQAPLPRFRDLLKVMRKKLTDTELSKPWAKDSCNTFWLSRSSHSIALIARCRHEAVGGAPVCVWIPDFFCDTALDPLRELRAQIVFYPLTTQFEPDWHVCELLSEQNSVDIFVHAHYFGGKSSVELSASFAKKHRAWLVEDAVHMLRPVAGVGELSDFILYSPHKHLPIPDGALLVVRENGPSTLGANEQNKIIFEKLFKCHYDTSDPSNFQTLKWLVKRLSQRLGVRAPRKKAHFYPKPAPIKPFSPKSMSPLSKRILAVLIPKLDEIAVYRSQLAAKWVETISWSSAGALTRSGSSEDSPYLVGFRGNNEILVTDTFNSLGNNAAFPVTSWPDLPEEVANNKALYKASLEAHGDRLYLPVHQSLVEKDIVKHGPKAITELTKSWKINLVSEDQWGLFLENSHKTNMLQSWQYGKAKEIHEGWRPLRFLISDDKNKAIALVQVLTKCLPFIGGIARVNRGPLLLNNELEDDVGVRFAALKVLIREARRQRWWLLSAALELPDVPLVAKGLETLGFIKSKSPRWTSGRISLKREEEQLLMSLKGKWRNGMRKGIKLGVKVSRMDCNAESMRFLMDSYTHLQSAKGFEGLSTGVLESLSEQNGKLWGFNLFFAFEEGGEKDHPIGVVVTVNSGDTSTYLIGTTNDKGRDMQANSVLLWESLVYAKASGCNWFDIGGLSDETPRGIASFKRGLNAEPYGLIGDYFKLIFPFTGMK